VVGEFETVPRGDLALPVLDPCVGKLRDSPAVLADDVVVVLALVEFEHRRPALEVMPLHEAGRLELRQHAVDRGEADVLIGLEQAAVYVLGAHVVRRVDGQDLEDLEPRHGDLEARASKLRRFHVLPVVLPVPAQPRGVRGCCIMRPHYVRRAPATPDIMSPSDARPRLPITVALALLLASATAGCVYRPDIQQGNLLTLTDVEQVTVGMSRSQVRYLLGTPMVSDPFAPHRWDYIYRRTHGRDRQVDNAHFIVRFEGDKVTAVEKVALPQPPGPERPASWRFWQKPPVDATAPADEPPTPPVNPLPSEPAPPNGA